MLVNTSAQPLVTLTPSCEEQQGLVGAVHMTIDHGAGVPSGSTMKFGQRTQTSNSTCIPKLLIVNQYLQNFREAKAKVVG